MSKQHHGLSEYVRSLSQTVSLVSCEMSSYSASARNYGASFASAAGSRVLMVVLAMDIILSWHY